MTTQWHATAPEGFGWSAKAIALPPIGGRVYCGRRLGGEPLGWATVVAYFTEGEWVGVVARPDAPPAQFLSNAASMHKRFPDHPWPTCYHLFGAELTPPPADTKET